MNAFGAFDMGTDGMVSVTKLKENLTTMGEVMTESALEETHTLLEGRELRIITIT